MTDRLQFEPIEPLVVCRRRRLNLYFRAEDGFTIESAQQAFTEMTARLTVAAPRQCSPDPE